MSRTTSRETVSQKATRLKSNYRVIQVTPQALVVIGDHSTYKVSKFSYGWFCECPWTRFKGTSNPCSHIKAAQLALADPTTQIPVAPLAQALAGTIN